MGIVGLGRIGMAIAKRAEAFGMSIAYTSRNARARAPYPYFAERRGARRAKSTSSSSSRPAAPATRKLIDAKVLAALGKKGYLVNVARGSVVDEQALVSALRDGTIAGAGLDVFENEPNVPSELLALDNVVLTPHVGSATWQTRQAMADLAFGNLEAHFAGRPLLSPVPMSAPPASICRRRSALSRGAGRASAWPSRAASPAAGARVVLTGRTRPGSSGCGAAARRGLGRGAVFDVADPTPCAAASLRAGLARRRPHPASTRRIQHRAAIVDFIDADGAA